jgi:DNA-binding NarL/FixJ family response regulator
LPESLTKEFGSSFPHPALIGDKLRKPQILLADDHPGLVTTVESLLEPSFELVGTVSDGESLFRAAMDLKPEVIITDISMPILNGIDAATKLKESGCTSRIVFLTVHPSSEYVRACLATGAFGYVVKSQMATDLVPAILEALAGRIFISPHVRRGINN